MSDWFGPLDAGGETRCEKTMKVRDFFSLSDCLDTEFLAGAGPVVLRLKLIEISHLSQDPRMTREMRRRALASMGELQRLTAERPCVSRIDRVAQRDAEQRQRDMTQPAFAIRPPGHA